MDIQSESGFHRVMTPKGNVFWSADPNPGPALLAEIDNLPDDWPELDPDDDPDADGYGWERRALRMAY